MPQLSMEIIVLKKTKLSEMDLIVTGLASDGLQVRAVAKGGRKPGSRRGAHLELFSRSRLLLHQGRSELLTVTEAELAEAHAGCRVDVEHAAAAAALAELVEQVSRDAAAEPRLFPLLDAALSAIEATPPEGLALMAAAGLMKVVSQVGFRPNLEHCLACGTERAAGSGMRFSFEQGGVVCAGCSGLSPGEGEDDGLLLDWVEVTLSNRFAELTAYATLELQPLGRRLLAFAAEWLRTQVSPRNRSLDFLLALPAVG